MLFSVSTFYKILNIHLFRVDPRRGRDSSVDRRRGRQDVRLRKRQQHDDSARLLHAQSTAAATATTAPAAQRQKGGNFVHCSARC